MSPKHAAAERPRTLRKLLLAVAGSVTLAIGTGAVSATLNPSDHRVVDPTAAPSTTTPQPRTTERVSRQKRRPSPSASPSHEPTRSGPKVVDSGTCGTSYYDEPQGTANGEQFDPDRYTAAHRTLPFDTRVRVTNPDNGKSVIVRINDRGPYVDDRCLDLSRAAFARIAPLSAGVITAKYEVLD